MERREIMRGGGLWREFGGRWKGEREGGRECRKRLRSEGEVRG